LTDSLTATYHAVMRSQTVSLDEARNRLADLVAKASQGSEVIIHDKGKALARIVPVTDPSGYRAHPPTVSEFSSDEESLTWDPDGWENVA